MHGDVGMNKLGSIIHPYPTRADAIRASADEYFYDNITRFTKAVLQGILSWNLR
jgi:hypothetical protein